MDNTNVCNKLDEWVRNLDSMGKNDSDNFHDSKMKISGQLFKIGESFFDDELNHKVRCVDADEFSCLDCIYYSQFPCKSVHKPECRWNMKDDKIDVIFLKLN